MSIRYRTSTGTKCPFRELQKRSQRQVLPTKRASDSLGKGFTGGIFGRTT